MPGLNLYRSNRLDLLADELARSLAAGPGGPLARETIVTQSKGMQRWISLAMAERFGIWMNFRYLFPNEMVQEIFQAVIPGITGERLFRTDVMTWRVVKILPGCLGRPGFEGLGHYLGGARGGLKLFQLAEKIVDLYDQYLTYRPDWILSWEKGKEKHWQAELWRTLREGDAALEHPPALREKFFREFRRPASVPAEKLPLRVSLFGIAGLPKFHMEVFAAVASSAVVNFFLLNPTEKYWSLACPGRDIAAQTRGTPGSGASMEELHIERGNSLLASMGRQGGDFLDLLTECDPSDITLFRDPGRDSLLRMVQHDIFHMIDRGASGEEGAEAAGIPEKEILADDSVRVHSCHGAMREAEVLHDCLLDMFNRDKELQPRDILVMTPDIETYAPFIHAVFGARGEGEPPVPYSVIDRRVRNASRTVDTFFAVLDLAGSRFEASRVMAVLECDDIQRRYGIVPEDLDLVRKWVMDTRIAWGIDREHRVRAGVPGFGENSWKAGMDRLFLGYAMEGDGENVFRGILPYRDLEGSQAEILGRFASFYRGLVSQAGILSGARPLGEWRNVLSALLDELFLPDEETQEYLRNIRNVLHGFGEWERVSDFHDPVGLPVMRWLLHHALMKEVSGGEFITGRVTFCAMLPMRSIPFKVVCMIGMNDGAFPRVTGSTGLDLMAQDPRPGDRSLRDEDRALFLESLVSAREKIHISYCGQGIQDNRDIPPSVLVSELLDYIEQGYRVPGGKIRDRVLVKHPLQAFSPRYYDRDGRLFSYSMENFASAKASMGERIAPSRFLPGPLPLLSDGERSVTVRDMLSFFDLPVKFLLGRRLGLRLDEESWVLEDREPFTIDSLDRYGMGQDMLKKCLEGRDPSAFYDVYRSKGQLPPARIGEYLFHELLPGVKEFAKAVRLHLGGEVAGSIEISLRVSGFIISGEIPGVTSGGIVRYRYGAGKAKDRLRSWILHLLLNTAKGGGARSVLLCKKDKRGGDVLWEMPPLDRAAEHLGFLMECYGRGMREPLPFFPESSLAYAKAVLTGGKQEEDALRGAEGKWNGDGRRGSPGEKDDPSVSLAFDRELPFDQSFRDLALGIFGPLLEHQTEVKR